MSVPRQETGMPHRPDSPNGVLNVVPPISTTHEGPLSVHRYPGDILTIKASPLTDVQVVKSNPAQLEVTVNAGRLQGVEILGQEDMPLVVDINGPTDKVEVMGNRTLVHVFTDETVKTVYTNGAAVTTSADIQTAVAQSHGFIATEGHIFAKRKEPNSTILDRR